MAKEHFYRTNLIWSGVEEKGPARDYRGYSRNHLIRIDGKPDLTGSADPGFRGDASRHNPEDLLVASLSACHMLWYLHLSFDAGILVTGYEDAPVGFGEVETGGAGRFTAAELRPTITVAPGTDVAAADAIHHRIHEVCFIARSVNFPVRFAATYVEAAAS